MNSAPTYRIETKENAYFAIGLVFSLNDQPSWVKTMAEFVRSK